MSVLYSLDRRVHADNYKITLTDIAKNVAIDGAFSLIVARMSCAAARLIKSACPFQVSCGKTAFVFGATNAALDTAIEVFAPNTFKRLDFKATTVVKATLTGIGSWAALNCTGYALSGKQAMVLGVGSYAYQSLVKMVPRKP